MMSNIEVISKLVELNEWLPPGIIQGKAKLKERSHR